MISMKLTSRHREIATLIPLRSQIESRGPVRSHSTYAGLNRNLSRGPPAFAGFIAFALTIGEVALMSRVMEFYVAVRNGGKTLRFAAKREEKSQEEKSRVFASKFPCEGLWRNFSVPLSFLICPLHRVAQLA